jgi:hypothetical protein
MAKVALNYFKRQSLKLQTLTQTGGQLSSIYVTPFEKASVIISALATNTSNTNTNTVYAALSTEGTAVTQASNEAIPFLSNFAIAPNDTVNIVVNKLVLGQYDHLYVWAGDQNQGDVNLTLSILETVNTQ